jgi:hypothetical protein
LPKPIAVALEKRRDPRDLGNVHAKSHDVH